ncbi:aspartate racemase [Actinomycetospora sp. NBRC 106375]|uniref:aspartate/glutamate racemase family protein n=1 Tax=Actinomycetospora sp. NBRC 106375 TaxID=3032207 RepID=UPI0024A1C711|nr:amino acid racemase [Actinomycetospora sp. NBRC 106375]GLZ50181.1 aspartate racemase [Actinomycetospora sp. NBRC 106375]
MPHTGILAANPDGAAQCFLRYCRAGAAELGSHTYPDVSLDYIGFGHHLAAWRAGDLDTVGAYLARSVARLAAAGADFFVCPDNTVHLVLDELAPELPLPGVHIARAVAETARAADHRRVGVLGTAFVTGSALYATWLGAEGIEVEVPDPPDAERLDRIILGELVNGAASDASRSWGVEVVRGLAERGCDVVALASTELPLLLAPEDSPLPVIDSTAVLADRALDVALSRTPLPTWRGGRHRTAP